MTCPYCGKNVLLRDSSVIYNGKSYGMAWVCSGYPTCDAYVGCHRATNKPLGRLANKELRTAKMAAHKAFDVRWKGKTDEKLTRNQIRQNAYAWLARTLGIRFKDCHIGEMDVAMCWRVVEVCK